MRAYVPERLNEQFDDQARYFINHPLYNEIEVDNVKLSSIFRWFEGDFNRVSMLIEFLNMYSETRSGKGARISYKEYDWQLNK